MHVRKTPILASSVQGMWNIFETFVMEAFSSWKKLKVKNNCIDIISGKQENDRKLQREGRDGPPVVGSIFLVGNIFFNQHFTATKY